VPRHPNDGAASCRVGQWIGCVLTFDPAVNWQNHN